MPDDDHVACDRLALAGGSLGVLGSFGWVRMVSVGPCTIKQADKSDILGKSMCLLAIDAFSEIDIIEDDLFLGFIYPIHYPLLHHSILKSLLPQGV